MKFIWLFLVFVACAGGVRGEDAAVAQAKPETNGPPVLWAHIFYPPIALLRAGMLFRLHRQESGLSLSIAASEQFLEHGNISVRLHHANGETVSPQYTVAESAGVAGSFGGSWGSQVEFPWGKNVLEEAWIEISTEAGRIWLEIPYGFTRDPKAPPPPPTLDGDARFAPAMKQLAGDPNVIDVSQAYFPTDGQVSKNRELICHWGNVQYDSFPIQNGWHLTFTVWNTREEPPDEVDIARGDTLTHPWDLHSPRTGLRLVQNSGHKVSGRCLSIRVHNNDADRSDAYRLNGSSKESHDRRSWEKLEIDVDDKTYPIMVPSSLFKSSHGGTSVDSKIW